MRLVVDANILFAALIKEGLTAELSIEKLKIGFLIKNFTKY